MGKKLTTEEFIERAIDVYSDRYDYSKVIYENARTKVNIICPEHGEFQQTPSNHLKHGCPECGKVKVSLEKRSYTKEFIKKSILVHGDKYDYSKVEYKGAHKKVKIICPEHGEFLQTPHNHLRHGCNKCGTIDASDKMKYSAIEFVEKAQRVHGMRYDYSKVEYKGTYDEVKIVCKKHGSFFQTAGVHLNGSGCNKCGREDMIRAHSFSTKEFIEQSKKVHGNRYDYSKVNYANNGIKVEIICPKHGSFFQVPATHIHNKSGCPNCAGRYKENYSARGLPVYDIYVDKLEPYGEKCRRAEVDPNILEIRCKQCHKWFTPEVHKVWGRVKSFKTVGQGENHFYCSEECKKSCTIFGQKMYPKGFKNYNNARPIQGQLRKLVLERDNYTCQICGAPDVPIICHHIEPVKWNPIESADIDNCLTVCADCDRAIHSQPGCTTSDIRNCSNE